MNLIGLGSVLAEFFDSRDARRGPSHQELTEAIRRAGLIAGDPVRLSSTAGKVTRVRQVFDYATDRDPNAGLKLAQDLVVLLRCDGMFDPNSPKYAGEELARRLADAFKEFGWSLCSDGILRAIVLENLDGKQLTSALWAYVRRANTAPDDPGLLVGTGKDLAEATARHVLTEHAGSYKSKDNFPTTLAAAFSALGLAIAPGKVGSALDADPAKAVEQCLFQLACAVNRLRNSEGVGHGRPNEVTLLARDARMATRATALVAELLLERLDP